MPIRPHKQKSHQYRDPQNSSWETTTTTKTKTTTATKTKKEKKKEKEEEAEEEMMEEEETEKKQYRTMALFHLQVTVYNQIN